MVNQRRYKRGKKTNRRKTERVRRSRVKRSRVKRSRVKRTKMRGGMEGTSDTTGQVPGDTEVPFLQYDFDKTYNSKNYKTWMKNIITSEGAKRDKYNKFIKEYEERCKKEYLRESEQFLKMKSLGMTTEEYLENTQKAGELQISLEEYLENTQKAGELQISLEEYLDLKKTAENAKMTVKDFLDLKRKLETSQMGTSLQTPQLQHGYESPINK